MRGVWEGLTSALGYRLRQRLRWSPRFRPPRPRDFAEDRLRLTPAARVRAEALRAAFPAVAAWSHRLHFGEWHEALYVLDSLLALRGESASSIAAGLDVGSKNGIHLPALHAAWPGRWTLIELDAHRRYGLGHTRRARAEALLAAYPASRFLAGSVTELSPADARFDVITWTLPFVFVEPLRAWGLPARFFQPAALLAHVLALLASDGSLFIVNQGEAERDEQRRLLDAAGARVEEVRALDSPLSPFRRPRFGLRVRAPSGGVAGRAASLAR
ncbi:MAG TPA: hypothetical protein VHU40_05745 [Polyangia bacterium]|nr:hypothetical protein [Polyangia bacterium]